MQKSIGAICKTGLLLRIYCRGMNAQDYHSELLLKINDAYLARDGRWSGGWSDDFARGWFLDS